MPTPAARAATGRTVPRIFERIVHSFQIPLGLSDASRVPTLKTNRKTDNNQLVVTEPRHGPSNGARQSVKSSDNVSTPRRLLVAGSPCRHANASKATVAGGLGEP
jgi:hypothetical protein